MWTGSLMRQNIVSAIALVGLLIWYSGGRLQASARYDWCYNDCGSEASCDLECENDGGGTTTCGEYDTGAPDWCDSDECDIVCTPNSNPETGCVWESQPSDCETYGVYGYCGDDACQGSTLGETCGNCDEDCGVCPPPIVCGNDDCEFGETYVTCPEDCDDPGSGGECGDGVCSALNGENDDTCYEDCATPNERCEDDFDCGAGYTCAAGGEPFGGQCVKTSLVWTFGQCNPGQCATGYRCRQVGGEDSYCIWWYDLQ